jgi:hypothetical protein
MCHHLKDMFTLIIVEIAMTRRHNRDEKACQSKNFTNTLRRICHTYDEKESQVATKNHHNRDKTSCQSKKSPTPYDTDAIHVTKKIGKVRRKIMEIETKNLGKVKTQQCLATNLCCYFHAFCWF